MCILWPLVVCPHPLKFQCVWSGSSPTVFSRLLFSFRFFFLTEHLFCCLVALLKVGFGNLKTILDLHEVVVRSSLEVLLPVACQLGGW